MYPTYYAISKSSCDIWKDIYKFSIEIFKICNWTILTKSTAVQECAAIMICLSKRSNVFETVAATSMRSCSASEREWNLKCIRFEVYSALSALLSDYKWYVSAAGVLISSSLILANAGSNCCSMGVWPLAQNTKLSQGTEHWHTTSNHLSSAVITFYH